MPAKKHKMHKAKPLIEVHKNPEVNLFKVTQLVIGGLSLLMGIFLLMAYSSLTPVVGVAMLFGIFAMMTGMRA